MITAQLYNAFETAPVTDGASTTQKQKPWTDAGPGQRGPNKKKQKPWTEAGPRQRGPNKKKQKPT